MSFIQDEVILPFSVISLIAGYQLAIFFLYQYLKLKDENIELNKILLAYALFFVFAISGSLLRVLNSYFLLESSNYEIITLLSVLLFILAIDSFLIIVSTKPFHQISRPLIPRLIVLVTIIAFITIVSIINFSFFPNLFPYILVVVLIGYVYILFFQYKLINLSARNIRKRLILILIGEILLSGAIVIGNKEFRTTFFLGYEEILLLISLPFVILSLLIIYFGVYKFPAFLEFDWKKKILQLLIINEKQIEEIYSFDFKAALDNAEKREFTDIMSSVIIGIEEIVSEITYIKEIKTSIIKKGDMTILLEYSNEYSLPLVYALIVSGEKIESLKYFLKTVKEQFQGFFKEILLKLNDFKGEEKRLFSSFDIIMKNLIQ